MYQPSSEVLAILAEEFGSLADAYEASEKGPLPSAKLSKKVVAALAELKSSQDRINGTVTYDVWGRPQK